MNTKQTIGLVIALVTIIGAIGFLNSSKVSPKASASMVFDVAFPATTTAMASGRLSTKESMYPHAKEITDPSGFVNTNGLPVTISQYIGKKVVLLDIMTYSCINCIRTFPYLVDWYKKYEDKGLVIIGIHTPEFEFEKDINNVKMAMAKYGITFPVVLDNNYGTWNAYKNLYWPRKYLIDIDGFIRYDHVGEGGYDETEAKIQELLKERADVLGVKVDFNSSSDSMMISDSKNAAPAMMGANQSPETYFGSARNEFFGNPSNSGIFTVPQNVDTNHFYLDGAWTITADHAENSAVPARIVYPFSAKNVYLVASAVSPVTVDVVIDSKQTGSFAVSESRLYNVYLGDSFGSHTLELRPQSKGLKAFTLTFGN